MNGPRRPLSALLSQVLVAFTVELDNEFERRMGEAGYPGAGLSLMVWLNLVRFIAERGISVQELTRVSLAPKERFRHELGCLERWHFIVLNGEQAGPGREGWGSGRGIRGEWVVELTGKGTTAAKTWPPLLDEIEHRWEERFGSDRVAKLRELLLGIVNGIEWELPQGLPCDWAIPRETNLPKRTGPIVERLSLATLLAQSLYSFALEHNREARVPLAWGANALRVLGEQPIPLSDIPRLTGSSPETSGHGWQLSPYVTVQAAKPPFRGKVICLNQRGLSAQLEYRQLIAKIEKEWEGKFGPLRITELRGLLESLFEPGTKGRPLLAIGMSPPPGVRRAGDSAPSLGRKMIGAAALLRLRHLLTQTESFIEDPANALPHYPLWDMNRGFGP